MGFVSPTFLRQRILLMTKGWKSIENNLLLDPALKIMHYLQTKIVINFNKSVQFK